MMSVSKERQHTMAEADIFSIGPTDVVWHDRFFHHAAEIFGVDFSRWAARGGWQENYRVVAAVEGSEIIATVGITRMRFSLGASEATGCRHLIDGIQLGAVATRSDRRGEGYARRLIQDVIACADAARMPVVLFANPSVTEFYPKFGFLPLLAQRPSAEMDIKPRDGGARLFDVARGEDRNLLGRLCSSSPIHGGILATPADPSTLLWYLCNGFTKAYVLQEERAIVFVEATDDRLILQEWIGAPPVDLVTALSSIVTKPVKVVGFGFVAPQTWPIGPMRFEPDPGAFMFWRGPELPAGDLCFPTLMRT
jgi:GNAT superfamily N-acetyltransferase